MKMNGKPLAVLGVTLGLAASGGAIQEMPAPSPPKDVVETRVDAGEVVRIGGDYVLPAGQRVESVVILSGTARIEGEVRRELVVVAGTAILAGTARVGGDVVVAAGAVEVQPGAVVGGDLVVVGRAEGAARVRPGRRSGVGRRLSVGGPSRDRRSLARTRIALGPADRTRPPLGVGRPWRFSRSCACSSTWCSTGPCEPVPAPSAGSP